MNDRDIYLDAQDITYLITALDEHAYRLAQNLARNYKGPIDQAGPEANRMAERVNRCAEIASKLSELRANYDQAVVHVERITP